MHGLKEINYMNELEVRDRKIARLEAEVKEKDNCLKLIETFREQKND